MKKPWFAYLQKFFAILVAMAAFLFAQNEARAAITVAQVTQAAVTTASTTQTTAAFTPVADTLYLMWTIQTIGTSPPTTPTVACANGLTMVQVNTVTFGTIATPLRRLTLFRAMKPSGLVNGACTITWGQTTTGHGHAIVRYNGVDTSGTDGSGAVLQNVTGRTNSATAAAGLSITLAALQAGSTTAGGFSNAVNNASSLTAGAGYTAGTGGSFNTPTTSIRAEWRTAGITTVNMTQSATSHIGGIAVEVKAKPTTTLATGIDPAAVTIAPGAAATDVNQFTLQTSSGTEAITSVTVNLSTNNGVGLLAITNDTGTMVLGSTASPVAGANTIAVTGMSASTGPTTFKIRVTPLSHALMPAVPGAAYAITAPVTAWVGPNTHAGSDTNPNALTIDNLSPSGATATSGTAGGGSVILNWTTSASADFVTTDGSVLYRWTTTAGSEVPAEGSAPTVNSANGAATVACVLSSTGALSGIIDGTGGSAGCNTTALAPGTAYVYKIFQKDTRGNYDTGVTIGTFTTTNAAPTTTSISPTSKTLGAATFTLTVNGTNFVSGSVVRFNGLDRTTTYVSPTQLTASIPATDLTTVGPFPITVFNPAPGGGLSNAQTFTVNPAAPSAVTNAASGVTSAVATLNGTVGTNGGVTDIVFEWGLTTAYGETITATQSPLAAGSPPYPTAPVSAVVEGLNCNTVFHYRVKATNSAGATNGGDSTFTTALCSAPFSPTACAATRYNGDLGCSAADVGLTNIAIAPTVLKTSCVSGAPVTLDLDLTVNFSSPNRYDVGIFIANDGKLPTLLPANGGASSCSVAVLPIVPETGSYTFPDLDGVPQGTLDTCGDGNSSISGGTGAGVKRMTNVTLPCYASPASGGKLFVPFAISWDSQRSPIGNLCTSNLYPVPVTSSKCNAPASSVNINVVVMPKINKTHSGASFNPGDTIAYTITVFNDSGGTLQASFFKDPIVANLAVTGLSCAAANGATCPIANNTVADMQGPTGIPIPSANLPNNSSLIFTVTGTLSGSIGTTIDNTATVSIGLNSNSSTDSVMLGAASGSKSFAPDSITEGNNSLITITFTNPTASTVTGVSFLDTYPAGLVNAASPGGSTTCVGTVTAIAGGNTLAFSGGTIPANGSCTVSVYVTSATANSYINSVSFTSGSHGSLGSASATLSVTAPVFGAFNACDDATDPNFSCTNTTTPTTSRITTKIAGSPFTLDLVALKIDGSWNPSYSNDVIVELLDSSNNSGAFDANNCRSSWTTVIATLGSFPNFGSSNGQITTLTSFTVPKAYRDVRVRVSNNGGATRVGCSTDNFVIRPGAVTLTTTTLMATPPSAGNLPSIKAGASFNLGAVTTTAATDQYADALSLDNDMLTAQITLQDATLAPGGVVGTLSPTTLMANTLPIDNASYDEVGYLYLAAGAYRDTSFTTVDQGGGDCVVNSTSVTLSGGKYGCNIGNTAAVSLGRFVPDHFRVVPGSIINRQPAGCVVESTFTYAGEEMQAKDFRLTAYNGLAAPTITKNYSGIFARFNGSVISNFYFGAVDLADLTPPTVAKAFVNGTNPGEFGLVSSSGNWDTGPNAGVGTFTANLKLNRAATPDGPYESFRVGIAPVDADGVTILAADKNLDITAPADSTPDKVLIGSSIMRFGRLKLSNAHGSELLNLPVPIQAQYWNGSAFVTNAEDGCTQVGAANIGLANYTKNLAAGETVVSTGAAFNAGIGSLTLSKPGATNNGSVDLVVNLGATATETPCITLAPDPVTAGANLGYLQGKWCGAAYDKDPTARATFGVFKGNEEFIYLREIY